MAYVFETERTAKFKFQQNDAEHGGGTDQKTTLTGINATLGSAESICAGVNMLMAIGSNHPYFDGQATRTVNQIVNNE